MKKLVMFIVVLCLGIVLVGNALATVAGSGGTPNPNVPDINLTGVTPGQPFDIDLGDVIWDPNGGPIIKQFSVTGPGDITWTETIHVGGTVPWTDWDEQIMVPDGTGGWMPSPDNDLLEWISPTTVNQPSDVTDVEAIDLLVIDFFPPLLPSTILQITKTISVPNQMTFQIWEWPTIPEPSMALMGIGLLALIRRKNKL